MADRIARGPGQELPHRRGHRRHVVDSGDRLQLAVRTRLVRQHFDDHAQPVIGADGRRNVGPRHQIHAFGDRVVKRFRQRHREENPGDGHGSPLLALPYRRVTPCLSAGCALPLVSWLKTRKPATSR